jgi:hypothetical protein
MRKPPFGVTFKHVTTPAPVQLADLEWGGLLEAHCIWNVGHLATSIVEENMAFVACRFE